MPILLNVLNSSDQKVVEQGSLCVSRIVESFKFQPNKLEELVSTEILKAILRLLLPGSTNLIGPNIHTQFLRVLSITARASPTLSAELFKMDVIDTLYQILTGVSPPEDTEDVASKIDGVVIMQALIHRPREQIYETLNVICELLPGFSDKDLPLGKLAAFPQLSDDGILPAVSKVKEDSNNKRIELLASCKDKVKRFATILLPTLTHAYSSTVNLSVRQKVLTAQLKMISNLDIAILESALRTVPFSSYLASILSQQDHSSLTIHAILAAELLLHRMEHVYGYQFFREGVVAEIEKLADRALARPESKEKGKDTSSDNAEPTSPTLTTHGVESDALDKEHQNHVGHGAASDDNVEIDEDDMEDDEGDHDEGDEDDDEDIDEDDDHQDLRDELSPSPSTSSSDHHHSERDVARNLSDLVTLQARRLLAALKNEHCRESSVQAAKTLNEVKALAESIRARYLYGAADDGRSLFKDLAKFFSLDTLKSMTSAELLSSDIVNVLLDVFDDGRCSLGQDARADFTEAFMDTAVDVTTFSQDTLSATPFSVLVHKLQDLLSRAEHFEVITVHQNSFARSRSSAASMLAKQLRLKLVADEDSEIPRPFRNIMVSIHAIATFKALDDYLRQRLALSERPRAGRHHDGLSSSLAALAAATGMPHHHRFLERGLFGMGESPSIPAGAGTGLPVTPRQEPSRSLRDRVASNTASPLSRTPVEAEKEKTSTIQKTNKRTEPPAEPTTPKAQKSGDSQELLECADERQLSDEDEPDEPNPLDTFVDDLEDDMENTTTEDPSAVNMEVASTGKVTARQEDGTRIPTPAQGSAYRAPSHPRSQLSTPSNPAARAMSYAAAIQSTPTDWHIEFSLDDQKISNDMTIYRAVHYNKDQPVELSTRNVWSAVHPIKFRKVAGPPPPASTALGYIHGSSEPTNGELPASLREHPATAQILRLLNTLHRLNANLEDVVEQLQNQLAVKPESLGQFVNTKLTAKLNRQLEEPLIVASNCLPSWSEDLARQFPFLFPFETRHLFLQSTSFGYSRSMTRWQNSQSANDSRRDRHRDDRPFLGRLQRQKVRISRTRILESAVKVLELYGSSPSILEVEYFEEVGTGLGPTLEFYSTVSKEFSRRKSKLWRENESSTKDEYAFGKLGLFPAPLSAVQAGSENGKKVLHLFKMLGKFVARSMLDSRIIDISFNPMFFKIGNDADSVPATLSSVRMVDPGLAASLRLIRQFAQAKAAIDSHNYLSEADKNAAAREIRIGSASIEDLGLDFTLPGYPSIELIDNGSNIPVVISNVERYLEAVIDLTLRNGVQKQIEAFKTGFSEVFSFSTLKSFTPDELVMLFGRIEEDWSIESE